MTESTVEYWHSAKRKPLEFSASSEFKYWELLQYPDQAEPELVEGRLNEETLNGWFTKVRMTLIRNVNKTEILTRILLYNLPLWM